MKIDFTSKDFKFISNHGEYYIEGEVSCTGDYTDWNDLKNIEDGWGMFEGLTMVGTKVMMVNYLEWMKILVAFLSFQYTIKKSL